MKDGMNMLALATIIVVATGCDDPNAHIRSYTVPKEAVSIEPALATLPSGEMSWEVPDGWQTSPNPNVTRFATMSTGDANDQLEIAVTRLVGTAGGIVANVNRWRGQIGLPPASEEEIAAEAMAIQAQNARAVVVDLVGPAPGEAAESQRMLAAVFPALQETWFIKMIGGHDTLETHRSTFMTLCESVRFDGSKAPPPPPAPLAPMADPATTPAPATPASPASQGSPAWSAVPAGWTRDDPAAAMSVVSFTVTGGGQEASLTITPLGTRQDLLGNINRWRRQVGLDPVTDLAEATQLEVAGDPATLVDLAGEARHTIGVVTSRGMTTWFYKLTGPDPLVADQRAAFNAFMQSIRFDG